MSIPSQKTCPGVPYKASRAPAAVLCPFRAYYAFFVRISDKGGLFINSGKKLVIALCVLAVLVSGAFFAYRHLTPKVAEGTKTITVSVRHADGQLRTFKITTAAEYLSGALEQEKLIEGTEGQYGLFVTSVDGEAVDSSKQQWWGYTKSGAYVDTGVDKTVISDGDSYEFSLHAGQ